MSETNRLEQARETSDYAHELQTRKGSGEPYSTHPHAVAEITSQYTDNPDAIIAAEFHDILEDVPADRYSEDRMREEYGDNVVELVKMVSENKRADDAEEAPWEERKQYYINHLSELDNTDALIISAADKIHNLNSMIEDYNRVGEDLWSVFNAPKEKQLWYYEQIFNILSQKDLPEGLIGHFKHTLDQFATVVTKVNTSKE
ncbi:MAG: HD domain-containing protein [Candidatus Saccharibacteria bacterium]